MTAQPAPPSPPFSQPPPEPRTYDPLRLCIYTTVALLAWLLGPWAVAFFAGLGVTGYVRARRAGLKQSKCFLRDTRLVLAYLGVILAAALVAASWPFWH